MKNEKNKNGDMCARNWFQGTSNCTSVKSTPNFIQQAPALLGTDPGIDGRCRSSQGAHETHQHMPPKGQGKQNCILAGYNVLSLHGRYPQYNLCCNLEVSSCCGVL